MGGKANADGRTVKFPNCSNNNKSDSNNSSSTNTCNDRNSHSNIIIKK